MAYESVVSAFWKTKTYPFRLIQELMMAEARISVWQEEV